MELSRFTDYALRALVYVGLKDDLADGSLATVTDIAESYAISRNHVVKVVQRLAHLGYVTTHRGRGGGMELAKAPTQIVVGKVVRATESLTLVECFDPDGGSCPISSACELKRALGRARESFLATLDEYTLADLMAPERQLRRALGVSR